MRGFGQHPSRRRPGRSSLAWLAAGAALAYLLDAAHSRRRRERVAGALRHGARRLTRETRAAALQSLGRSRRALHRLLPTSPGEPLDDAGLAHKVESVLFRDPHVPKGQISINAERGAVFLRGQVESQELIDDLVASVRKIRDVSEVVNLLHLPGTDAPHAHAPRTSPNGARE